MSWTCRVVGRRPVSPQVGDMWFADFMTHPEYFNFFAQEVLSRDYLNTWYPWRAPLIVVTPGRCEFLIDGCYRLDGAPDPERRGWRVSGGPPPLITVAPIIEAKDGSRTVYRGYLFDGTLSDDVDGRRFLDS